MSNLTPIQQALTITGAGSVGIGGGALYYLAGANNSATWSGNITMDGNTTFSATTTNPIRRSAMVNTGLTITGSISDNSTGHNLTKEGNGEIILKPGAAGNSYRGTTTINNGVLDLQSNLALGASSGTTVNAGITETGALEIGGPGLNITIANEPLTLNGDGAGDPRPGAPDNSPLDAVGGAAQSRVIPGPAPSSSAATIPTIGVQPRTAIDHRRRQRFQRPDHSAQRHHHGCHERHSHCHHHGQHGGPGGRTAAEHRRRARQHRRQRFLGHRQRHQWHPILVGHFAWRG